MKKVILIFALTLFFISFISAEYCQLDVSLLNQDPYPAIPGEYVEIVFQIEGLANQECGTVYFELLEKYPIAFDPEVNPRIKIESGTYQSDYSSFKIAPYKARVDENALDGNTPIEVQYKYGTNIDYETQKFNLNVRDSRADFEIYITNYDPATKEITFEILNTAKSDIESLTLEIPKQDNIEIIGAKTNILGDLDSNEYTTADFKAIPKEGNITISISYTDSTNARRTIEKKVYYEPQYFKKQTSISSIITPIIWIIVIGGVIYFFYRRRKKKRMHQQHLHQGHKK